MFFPEQRKSIINRKLIFLNQCELVTNLRALSAPSREADLYKIQKPGKTCCRFYKGRLILRRLGVFGAIEDRGLGFLWLKAKPPPNFVA